MTRFLLAVALTLYGAVACGAEAASASGSVDPCLGITWPGGIPTHDSDNPIIVATFLKVLAVSRLPVPVVVCQVDDLSVYPVAIIAQEVAGDGAVTRAFLIVPRKTAGLFSDGAYEGMFAHELAHTLIPSTEACGVGVGVFRPELSVRLECEMPVDERAAAWVGTQAVIDMLRETEKYFGPYLDSDARDYLQQEVDARVARLTKSLE